MNRSTTLRARWVVPIAGPPIENGFLEIGDGRVLCTGKATAETSICHDLGDTAILPGLVNAHTHLEFSDLVEPVGHAGMELADWIVAVIKSRNARSERDRDAPQPDRDVITTGAIEAAQSGTALIGEIATTPWQAPATEVTVVSYAEVLGLSASRAAERFQAATQHAQSYPHAAGISPHAPYSAPPELIKQCIDFALRSSSPLAMHVAESPAERELLQHGSGPFAENLQSLGLDVAAHFPWRRESPMNWLIDSLAHAPAASIVHGNDLRDDEIHRMAIHPSLSVVYCPRTHAYFGHAPHPVAKLLAAGINVGLGTDSRASNPDLQLWREVQFLLNERQDLPPDCVLQMATQGGAIAMQRGALFGSLLPGRVATLATIPTQAPSEASLYRDFSSAPASLFRLMPPTTRH
ncbi:amidohydrolase family protein [Allorhodopirellula solitaria]|uniref:amidohydrolase family protein n=1 Tax=Allorhodopirellula solitaria TaxID=2527987 RepID=UPI001FE51C7B|nr:amidohydrolase family protein [Allorhodopirellula solitaria]